MVVVRVGNRAEIRWGGYGSITMTRESMSVAI